MNKRVISILLVFTLVLSILGGCTKQETEELNTSNEENIIDDNKDDTIEEVPVINMAWDFDLHASVMLVASARGEEFKDSGIWLKPIIEKEQYELYKEGEKLALINTIVTKGSSESAVMLGQKRLDCALNSVTGMLSAKDQGTDVEVLCPVHVDGIGLVFPHGTELNNWEEVSQYILDSETPVRIGYHSPVSAPRIVLETALKQADIKVTENPNDFDADVLLVDLKGAKNLLPAFSGDQVDAWVAPSHYPEAAEAEGIGSIALKLNEFPPEGQWYDFPCCVFAGRADVISEYPEVFEALVDLFTYSAEWINSNRDEASMILSEIIGVSKEAVDAASIVFTTQVSDKWKEGVGIYFDLLDELEKFDGDLKGGKLEDIEDEFYNFKYINN
ncbi:conserved exported hypothetical protein [[Clostridium] ultunense Esp]|uniref:Uncharacterized protein n=1 Tax=[Clostridium] ultunense Esp TaxID=1288971 RepID=M1Z5X1_9FIRM|nr:ABC transporter substrate-binding protein [Schnuerera ultunensis]CCQ93144.1 conserved exported hypothetical protein [[Clostridium] ultunense Esp]SHD76767.1 conserved exported protein of unknown function [[Clostridium] ultunense Esp]